MLKLRYLLIGLLIGALLFWYWNAEQIKPIADTQPVKTPPTPPPVPRKTTAATSKDALTEIDGIGPAYERALNALGIFTFAQLAGQNPDTLASQMAARVTAERIKREKWIEQAQSRSE
jgi:predicted flap endonuclease-1-like 5' DNA nuclease